MTYDVAVIGAGIAGASVAFELAATHSVVLLEAEDHPGYHATGRSAAAYIPSYGVEHPALKLLTRASLNDFVGPDGAFTSDTLVRPRPLLHVAPARARKGLEDLFDVLRTELGSVEWLDEFSMRQRFGYLSGTYQGGGVLETGVFDIDVHALHDAYLRGARRRGCELRVNARVAALARSQAVWRLDTQPSVTARTVVNAAGAWGEQVATMAGVRPVGLQPLRRTAIIFDPPPGSDISDWPLVAALDGSFYFKPDAGRVLGSAADEVPSSACDAHPEELDIAYAAERVGDALEYKIPSIRRSWAGLRSFVADRNPVIGYAPDVENFFWLVGQGGHGIQTAPAVARFAACSIRNDPLPADLADLDFMPEWVSPARIE